jgi:predicted RNA-binding protein with PIN domain
VTPELSPPVLVDAENVRRSLWPNLSPGRLVELACDWSDREARDVVLVFDGSAPGGFVGSRENGRVRVVGAGSDSADDLLVRAAAEAARTGLRVWLVTSDRELRARVGDAAERVVGGGSFARELAGTNSRPGGASTGEPGPSPRAP